MQSKKCTVLWNYLANTLQDANYIFICKRSRSGADLEPLMEIKFGKENVYPI